MTDDNSHIPRGRFTRLAKVAGMTARVGTGLLANKAKNLLGGNASGGVDAAVKVVETLGELKGVALKMGQLAQLKSADLPPEVRKVLGRVFSQAPALPYADIEKVIVGELGKAPPELFESFEEKPFAAASLGQVHRARTKDGHDVAVKVQYPGVAGAIDDDLRSAGAVATALGIGGDLIGSKAYYEELARELRNELDYTAELQKLENFRGHVTPWPELVVPRAFPELCGKKVLTLERLEGPTLDEFSRREDVSHEERYRVAVLLVNAIYGPFMRDGVIHGDTHPGNFILMPDGRLGILDFGSIKTFSSTFRDAYREAIASVLREERRPEVLHLLVQAGFTLKMEQDRAKALIDSISDIVSAPLLGEYDFASGQIEKQLQELVVRRAPDFVRVRPPAEGMLFYRALVGLQHAMRALRVKGDFRPVLRSLIGPQAYPVA